MKDFNENNFGSHTRNRGPHGARGGFGPGFGGPGPRGGFFNPARNLDPRQFGGPFGGPDRRAPRGGIRLGLLALLGENDSQNGYNLMQAFAAKTNGNWNPKSGSVYPVLNQLIDEGLVSVDENGVYTLTDQGRAVLDNHKTEIDGLFQRFADHQMPVLFDTLRKLMPALHQFAKQATPEQQEEIAAKLDEVRKDIYRKLAE